MQEIDYRAMKQNCEILMMSIFFNGFFVSVLGSFSFGSNLRTLEPFRATNLVNVPL